MAVDPAVLKRYIEDSGLSPRQNSTSWIFNCPRCGKAKKLYMKRSTGQFRCFYCYTIDGFGGRPEYALSELLNIPVGEIKAKLYLLEEVPDGVELDTILADWFAEDEEPDEDADPLRVVQWPLNYYPIQHKHAAKGLAYLESRGIPADVAAQYDIRYAPEKQRVVFPVQVGGKLYGWQGRLVVPHQFWNKDKGQFDEVLKVVSSKQIPRDRTLMFADRLVGSDHAVLCEGPVDALKAHLCGGNVATMGKGVSYSQLALLRNAGIRKVYLALDPDAGDEMERLATLLSDMETYLIDPSPAKDIGELDMQEVLRRFRAAPRVDAMHCFTSCLLGR